MNRSRLLLLNGSQSAADQLMNRSSDWDIVHAETLAEMLEQLEDGPVEALLIDPNGPGLRDRLGRLAQSEEILEALDIGIAILNSNWVVRWANGTFRTWCDNEVVGQPVMEALGGPEIKEGDRLPFDTASAGLSARFRLLTNRSRYLESHLMPLVSPSTTRLGDRRRYVIQLRDITPRVLQQQKLDALHAAGSTLAGLTPEQLEEMPVEQRIELLRQNLRKSIHEVLDYEVIEIRMLDRRTNRLEPLLAEGMLSEAQHRELYALKEGNGVTGWVAATGESYLCKDTSTDPHYIKGSEGARSSMTVPLKIMGQVIGTFNVESPVLGAFGEDELQFAELFAREIAKALHMLELLNAQRLCAASESLTAVNREIALPVDNILTATSWVLSNTLGLPDIVGQAMRRVLDQARLVKANIQKVGEDIGPTRSASAIDGLSPLRLRGKRVLVVDASEEFRRQSHAVLEKLGATVETAGSVNDALTLAPVSSYDAVIMDVKPPDMRGTEAFLRLREAHPKARMILMAEFGYDGEHTIVNCRQAGLKFVLFKPFLVNQLVAVIDGPEPAARVGVQPEVISL